MGIFPLPPTFWYERDVPYAFCGSLTRSVLDDIMKASLAFTDKCYVRVSNLTDLALWVKNEYFPKKLHLCMRKQKLPRKETEASNFLFLFAFLLLGWPSLPVGKTVFAMFYFLVVAEFFSVVLFVHYVQRWLLRLGFTCKREEQVDC